METLQEKIIKQIREADITKFDWASEVLGGITDKYAKGYLTAKMQSHLRSITADSEYFRKEFIRCCTYDIWDK